MTTVKHGLFLRKDDLGKRTVLYSGERGSGEKFIV